MSLLGLPNELLQAIAVYCGVDGGGLARANRRLHDNTNDILWQSAIIDEESLTRITARAAQSGNLKTMKKAAAYGADFDLLHPVTWYQDMAEFDSATDLPDWRVGDELSQFWASPLHLAVYHNHYDTVEWLITVQGVDVDAPGRLICDCRGVADHNAYERGMFEDYPVWTALHFAICQQHDSISRLLLSRNATTSVMLSRSVMRDSDVISRCVEALRIGSIREFSGRTETMTALHVAALRGTKSLVTHLVQARGMDINECDRHGRSLIYYQPIHYAVPSQDETMIEHVVSLGANVDGTSMRSIYADNTPIPFAILHTELKRVFKLLDAGAKTWLDDGRVRTAILSYRSVLYIINRLGSPEKIMTVMVKLVDKTLQDYASDGTRCRPIDSEIRHALRVLSTVAPEDWNPSTAFSTNAKRLLRNVLARMADTESPHHLANHYNGTALARFAKKVSHWRYSLKSARRRKRT